ncbi:MAG: sugar phosphate nucleotidyltransferase [Rhodospirillales bacterium]|jgi:mannose-1-phosphate guanylyltransferase|nr:nucleotidyl transferase [Rhodospirillaceae bacterium]MDP6427072.1 sugar phosphate nucleotidyltransferase [Rhodospirillales bacterium]MDP6645248.1 sugar phosphate nucleotidyltransferase [Rhodospirillales bacterium]MDP6841876.1 sugar phosphate nucleotidyltransferase [Rhodospirillales bacterium]|tara:strand:+ start:847 stop:1572 length:726 start_codon:yes stop_codon:yes gene_type:complete
MTPCLGGIDVVVLAGGLGTRLGGVLAGTPKVLAPIGERPFLSILLAWLRRFGARRVIFGLGHLAGEVETYLQAHAPADIECIAVVEPGPLGTAGAIAHLAGEIQNLPVLVLNGDTFVDADICAFLDGHRASGAPGSILCTRVADAGRYGSVEIDDGGRIGGFLEKNAGGGGGVISAGVYFFERELLDMIAAADGPSLEIDLFQKLAPGTLHAHAGEFPFLDIGTPDDLARAPAILAPYIGD